MNNRTDELLARHQTVLCELLDVFDAVCRKHDIKYMLFAGTALGAVRHKGFIPWDDDLDVVMLRPEYERFMALAQGELDFEKYFLQTEFSEHWPMYFSKLRKNNTACLERVIPKDKEMHQGVYIDIFPCDDLADGPILRRVQFAASKVVIAKSLEKRGYLTHSAAKKLFMALCRLLPKGPLVRMARMDHAGASSHVHTFFGGGSRYGKNVYPREWFTQTVMMPFEQGRYPVSAHYDQLLTKLYGDYMTPPPACERSVKVHAEFVDLEHSYTEYLEQQQSASFHQHSRSIR